MRLHRRILQSATPSTSIGYFSPIDYEGWHSAAAVVPEITGAAASTSILAAAEEVLLRLASHAVRRTRTVRSS
jgi:hypothetical protein